MEIAEYETVTSARGANGTKETGYIHYIDVVPRKLILGCAAVSNSQEEDGVRPEVERKIKNLNHKKKKQILTYDELETGST